MPDPDLDGLLAAADERVHADPPATLWLDVDPAFVDALATAPSVLFLAGPGVLREGAEDGLRTLAAVTSAGVLNTWGAKGVLYWRSRHHLATIGLQAGDFTGSGLADTGLVVTTGLDERESPRDRWDLGAPTIDVPPRMLAPLAEVAAVARPHRDIPFPPIRTALGAVTARGWEATGPLPAPSALTRDYAQRVGAGGLVAADPGTAGFFVARTLPTEAPRSVAVPADAGAEGFAVAAVIAARQRAPHRRCLAVVDAPVGPRTAALLDVAASRGIDVDLEVWSPDTVDLAWLDAFVEVAGEIVAWRESPYFE